MPTPGQGSPPRTIKNQTFAKSARFCKETERPSIMDEKKPQFKRLSSPLCFYIAGGVFLAYSLIFPFYRLTHYLIAGALAAASYFISDRLLAPQLVEIKEEIPLTGDARADAAVKEGREYLTQLDGIADGIKSTRARGYLSSIDQTVEKILAAISDDPKKAPMVRRLMSYYLPTLIKLSDFYQKLEAQGGEGQNIEGSMERIEGNLELLDSALKKQLDLLYENDALDISSDISVMENMLAQEGLSQGLADKLQQMGGQE